MLARDESKLPTIGLQKITSPSDAIFLIPDVYLSILRVIPKIKDLVSLRGISKFFKNKIDEMLFKDPQVFWKVMSQLTWNQAIGFIAYFKKTAYYQPKDTSDLRNRIVGLNLTYNCVVVSDDTCLVKLFTYIQGRMFVFNDSHDFIRNISNLPAAGISAILLHLDMEAGISYFCQSMHERIAKSSKPEYIAIASADNYLCYAALAPVSKINIEILNKSMVEIRTVDFEQPPYANFIANLILSSKLSEPTLTEAEKKQLLSHRAPGYLNLSGLNFAKYDLKGFDFSGANLTNVNFEGANLHSCNFEGAFLQNTNLKQADCRYSNFRHAFLDNKCEAIKLEGACLSFVHITLHNFVFGLSLISLSAATIKQELDNFVQRNQLHIPLLNREKKLVRVLTQSICGEIFKNKPRDALEILEEIMVHPMIAGFEESLATIKNLKLALEKKIQLPSVGYPFL